MKRLVKNSKLSEMNNDEIIKLIRYQWDMRADDMASNTFEDFRSFAYDFIWDPSISDNEFNKLLEQAFPY